MRKYNEEKYERKLQIKEMKDYQDKLIALRIKECEALERIAKALEQQNEPKKP